MTHQFQVGDTGKTRDGREYRVICTDARGKRPIVALILSEDGGDLACCFHTSGRYNNDIGTYPLDLLPPPPKTKKIVRWVTAESVGGRIIDWYHHDECSAISAAATTNSLMPDGKPLRIEIEVLDK